MHWAEKFLKIEYKDMNCSKFVEHVLRNQFGINYSFPQSEGSLFNQSQQIRDAMPSFCTKTDSPKEGDMILMHGRRRMCHVGIYVRIGITDYVLHTESSIKTAALHPLKNLLFFGYTVEGFYTWLK